MRRRAWTIVLAAVWTVGVVWRGEFAALRAQSLGTEYQLPVAVSVLNSAAQEFAPAWNAAEERLYFTSTRSGKARFYVASYQGKGSFGKPTVAEELNFFDQQSYLTFATPRRAYFSAFWFTDRQPYLNIFEVQKHNGRWGKPRQVEFLKARAFTSHATTARNGRVMVFASDRPGGQGGIDLWITRQAENGVWEMPRPLTELNSPANEITPFLLAEDTLIFASNGFGGQGGYDLFLTVFFEGHWLPPVPLTTLNSAYDESDCIVLPDRSILFASNRPGGKGGLDFYIARPVVHPPPAPSLHCSVQFVPEAVTLERVRKIEVQPLLPYLFFPKNSDTLPAQWYRLLLPTQARQFDTAALAISVDTVYANVLNIIGRRLQRYPEATLTIAGYTSQDETNRERLARQRAEAVARYFQEVWHIDPDRLVIRTGRTPPNPSNPAHPEGREENRRVELSSSHPAILAPLWLERRQYRLQPEQVVAQFAAQPLHWLRSWQFHLRFAQGNAFYTTSGTALPSQLTVSLKPWIDSLKNVAACVGELVIVDTLGRQEQCRQSLPIALMEVTYQEHTQADAYQYSLILFDYDQATLSKQHRKQLEQIAVQIPPNAKVIVRGYTDVLGSEQYNYQLALQRAQAVARYLRLLLPAAEIYVEPVGEYTLVSNQTPYGRFYSRTVQILVETPSEQREEGR